MTHSIKTGDEAAIISVVRLHANSSKNGQRNLDIPSLNHLTVSITYNGLYEFLPCQCILGVGLV